jgi:hypothetical protein
VTPENEDLVNGSKSTELIEVSNYVVEDTTRKKGLLKRRGR